MISRAVKLMGGLGSEKIRWTESCSSLIDSYENLVGDSLVSAGTIGDCGDKESFALMLLLAVLLALLLLYALVLVLVFAILLVVVFAVLLLLLLLLYALVLVLVYALVLVLVYAVLLVLVFALLLLYAAVDFL